MLRYKAEISVYEETSYDEGEGIVFRRLQEFPLNTSERERIEADIPYFINGQHILTDDAGRVFTLNVSNLEKA